MAQPNKILVVEDDPDTAEMLRTYLEAQGYEIVTTAWGNEAIELCQKHLPDLIIQDIRLPDIDGYQVVSELRQNLRTSQIPIIFLTEKKARADKISGLKLGAVDYITKPFDMQELRLRVRNALRRAGFASLVNPVTGLPGQQVTEERIEKLMKNNDWAVMYVTISGLEPFNEVYGFVAGDDVLRAVGIIVSNVINEFGDSDDFVGHINKADFILITQEDRAKDIQDKLISRLGRAFNYFYPVKDIESGKMAAPMIAELGVSVASAGQYDTSQSILEAAIQARCQIAGIHTGKA
ncbi:MAG: response regulator [Anaerolineae bacterium]|nr:response regulator [Anaerolineae bacterium]